MSSENGIPRTFWHSVSIAILVFTFGLGYAAIKATHLTLKYKDAELILERAKEQQAIVEQARARVEADKKDVVSSIDRVNVTIREMETTAKKLEAEREIARKTVDQALKQVQQQLETSPENSAALKAGIKALQQNLLLRPETVAPELKNLESVKTRLDSTRSILAPDAQ